MSWNDYIANLQKDNLLEHACILDNDQYGTCGNSSNFELRNFFKKFEGDDKNYEIKEREIIKEIFQKEGIVPNPPGIYLNGEKYMLISYDETSNVCFLSKPNGGACLALSNKCVIIGTWNKDKFPNQNHGSCNDTVIKFAEYFIENNY